MTINVNKVKIFVTIPTEDVDKVRNAVCEAGAGIIGNYDYLNLMIRQIHILERIIN